MRAWVLVFTYKGQSQCRETLLTIDNFIEDIRVKPTKCFFFLIIIIILFTQTKNSELYTRKTFGRSFTHKCISSFQKIVGIWFSELPDCSTGNVWLTMWYSPLKSKTNNSVQHYALWRTTVSVIIQRQGLSMENWNVN